MSIKQVLLCVLTLVWGCLHGIFGADQTKNDAAEATKWWNQQFVLSAFTSVQNNDNIEDVIANFSEAGLNALEANTPLEYRAEDLTPENLIRTLNACEKHNIKFFITDHKRTTGVKNPKESELKDLVKEYAKFSALGGYYVWDEPTGNFDAVKESFRIFQAADPSRLPLVAFIPSYGPWHHPDKYPAMVRKFMKEVDPPILSFDYYSVKGNAGKYSVNQGVYQDLALWSSLSLETGKPLWMYVTSCKWQSDPSLETLRGQVYSAIAYGAKGIQYFVAKSFTGRKPSFDGAPLNMNGSKSKFFDTFKEFNQEIKAIAPVIMKIKLTRIMHTKPVPADNISFAPYLGINAVPDNLIISFHKSTDGHDYLLLVNKDLNAEHQITLGVDSGVSLVLLPDRTEKKRTENKISFEIPKGGGMLFEIRN
jgi:hypothetical protein